ncbi:GDSL esterase/lipase At1g54790-like [Camellia sinensis]|uniref:GDSL esterase/lipase At1g54790-like n=1 Tax=Camellia sinensis TaxID=4442 RepID=UPI0010362ED6|nr:GDSL esterase/lipase At1g54790-like [Camellia sinensis]
MMGQAINQNIESDGPYSNHITNGIFLPLLCLIPTRQEREDEDDGDESPNPCSNIIHSPLLANGSDSIVGLKYPAVFNFGDSNSDTGELFAGLGVRLGLPFGSTYFHKPSSRMCDGRLVLDFLMEAMGLPFLNPYLNAIGAPSFRNGCNFAASGCTVLPATAQSVCPFSFGIQVAQFLRLKAEVLQLQLETKELDKYLPPEDFFNEGLYMFDIGQNDFSIDLDSMSLHQVLALIQTILAEFEAGIKKLYDEGARNFWVHNMGPVGCIAQKIAYYGTDPPKLDEHGCVSSHNQAAIIFNLQLHELCRKLQSQYTEANITYTDIFTIKFDLIVNYSRYGFKQPIMACCGYGGPPLNYDSQILCGQTRFFNGSSVTAQACNDSTEYVSWDGCHFTEAANRHISSQILTGKFSDPLFSATMPSLFNNF